MKRALTHGGRFLAFTGRVAPQNEHPRRLPDPTSTPGPRAPSAPETPAERRRRLERQRQPRRRRPGTGAGAPRILDPLLRPTPNSAGRAEFAGAPPSDSPHVLRLRSAVDRLAERRMRGLRVRPARARLTVDLELAPATLARAQDAACGLDLTRWLVEVLECRLVESNCPHDVVRAAPPPGPPVAVTLAEDDVE